MWDLRALAAINASLSRGKAVKDPGRPKLEPVRPELEELARRADRGELRAVVGEVFDLADGAKAFDAKRGGGVSGKVVLRNQD